MEMVPILRGCYDQFILFTGTFRTMPDIESSVVLAILFLLKQTSLTAYQLFLLGE